MKLIGTSLRFCMYDMEAGFNTNGEHEIIRIDSSALISQELSGPELVNHVFPRYCILGEHDIKFWHTILGKLPVVFVGNKSCDLNGNWHTVEDDQSNAEYFNYNRRTGEFTSVGIKKIPNRRCRVDNE